MSPDCTPVWPWGPWAAPYGATLAPATVGSIPGKGGTHFGGEIGCKQIPTANWERPSWACGLEWPLFASCWLSPDGRPLAPRADLGVWATPEVFRGPCVVVSPSEADVSDQTKGTSVGWYRQAEETVAEASEFCLDRRAGLGRAGEHRRQGRWPWNLSLGMDPVAQTIA